LTLTAPHVRTDTLHGRVERIFDSWKLFLKQFNAWLRSIDAHRSSAWFRVFEWTIGDDGIGHPHLHVWLLCPFVPRDYVPQWWTTALRAAGCPNYVQPIRPDLHEVYSENGAASELIKYMTKDIDANGDKIPPSIYAELYKSLDDRRLTQGSRGFMALANRERPRCECGSSLPRLIRVGTPSDAVLVQP
jgi:hypothetical protein